MDALTSAECEYRSQPMRASPGHAVVIETGHTGQTHCWFPFI
jgi:hypothetical protein